MPLWGPVAGTTGPFSLYGPLSLHLGSGSRALRLDLKGPPPRSSRATYWDVFAPPGGVLLRVSGRCAPHQGENDKGGGGLQSHDWRRIFSHEQSTNTMSATSGTARPARRSPAALETAPTTHGMTAPPKPPEA
jgi:hypothetical protein